MIRLFIELYLDEDVSVLVADSVRAHGFVATTTQEAGMAGKGDPEQLARAVAHEATMLIHNRTDYEALAQEYFAAGRPHYGIIIAARRRPYELARRVLSILNTTTADEMENQLRYI